MRALLCTLICLSLLACEPRVPRLTEEWQPVDPARELVINNLTVVEDGVRRDGVWSLGHLIANASGSHPPSQFMLSFLMQWERDQTLNANPWYPAGTTAPARPAVRTLIIDPWLVRSGCAAGATECDTLDFSHAPFRLSAITSRLDKRGAPDLRGKVSDAGEARFIFHALGATGNALAFTLILEYRLNASTQAEVVAWAQRWHELGSIDFGDDYNAHLEALTEAFSRAGVSPDEPNGSSLKWIRTNEASLASAASDPTNPPSNKLWQLRSFRIGDSGLPVQTTVSQTPLLSLNGTAELTYLLNQNSEAILAGTYLLPGFVEDALSDTPGNLTWSAPGVSDPRTLQAFALNTCSGCHRSETDTAFVHIGRRITSDVVAPLSDWMVSQEIPRRVLDLTALLGGPEPEAPPNPQLLLRRAKAAGH